MHITPFTQTPHATAELVDLINYCQNTEAHLDIRMAEQDDIFQVDQYYRQSGGEFWVALDEGHIVGSIALLPVSKSTAVLKKFFTYPKYRGRPVHLGSDLYAKFIEIARNNFERVVLDTPEAEHRSHSFYERQGFVQIPFEELNVHYEFPNRASRFYELSLR